MYFILTEMNQFVAVKSLIDHHKFNFRTYRHERQMNFYKMISSSKVVFIPKCCKYKEYCMHVYLKKMFIKIYFN